MAKGFVTGAIRACAVVCGVMSLTFLLLHLAPGDPVERLLGPAATPSQVLSARHALGLDRSLLAQYLSWLGHALSGDFGTSIATGRAVGPMLASAWPATAGLVIVSLALTYLIGVTVGAIQANTRSKALDTTMTAATVGLRPCQPTGSAWYL